MTKVPLSDVKKRRATEDDVDIGRKVRAKRLDKGLSQSALADVLGITFQQVQKYEKGTNRISAGRLKKVAEALETPLAYFMGAGPKGDATAGFEFLQSATAVRLNRAFMRIKDRNARMHIVQAMEFIASLLPKEPK